MTSPVTRIAIRRIHHNWRRCLLLSVAVLFSTLMISFFLFFEFQLQASSYTAYAGLPFTEFLDCLIRCMNITLFFLVLITPLTVRTYCRIRDKENAVVLAVLASLGATERQKRQLSITEITVLYLPPVASGACLGGIPGITVGRLFVGTTKTDTPVPYIFLAIGMIFAGMLLITLCHWFPHLRRTKRSVIQSVKSQNLKASEQRHGYRQSHTFQNQILLKRLAKKSIDYYEKTYNGIALTLASSALYPILSILLFWHIGSVEIVLDSNPFDVIDTTAVTLKAVDNLLLFLGGCFLVLTCVGAMQVAFMARMQFTTRKKTAQIYLSIGMSELDIKKMIRLELQSVWLRSFVYLLFGSLIANACFSLLVGH